MMGVPLSPEPEVKSHREPIKSVSCLGVVPWDAMLPTRLSCLALILLEIASLLPDGVAALANATHARGKKVLAVGTTSVRVLESCCNSDGVLVPGSGRTNIFLYPPQKPHAVDMLLTNFHLPCSTLLMLVSCFCEREMVLAAYEKAKREKMRFYSYGDCMLLK